MQYKFYQNQRILIFYLFQEIVAALDQLGPDGKPRGFIEVVPGGLSVGVPGNLRLAELAHKQWGKLAWADLFAPAIRLAEQGFEVTPALRTWLVRFEPLWKDFPAARALYYVDGQPAPLGTRIRNPAYAALLRDVAQGLLDVVERLELEAAEDPDELARPTKNRAYQRKA